MTAVLDQYAPDWHLGPAARATVTETVRAWREFQRAHWPLPHPSPRNNLWLRRNPWFATEVLPELRRGVQKALA